MSDCTPPTPKGSVIKYINFIVIVILQSELY
jgi:hypothetical protein